MVGSGKAARLFGVHPFHEQPPDGLGGDPHSV